MGTVKIFIASSAELLPDREALELLFARMTSRLLKDSVNIETVVWENFLDSVSLTRKQDDYNAALKKSDIVISLFYTKAGMYTQEEFDTALKQFNETGAPIIYTFFKEPEMNSVPEPVTNGSAEELVALAKSRQSLKDFKKRLEDLGHFYTRYKSTEDLKFQFKEQLEILDYNGFIKLREEKRSESREAVTNYIKNVLNINTAVVQGNNNIVVQGANESTITIINNGVSEEYKNDLNEIKNLLKSLAANTIQVDGRDINIEGVNDANFGFLMGRATKNKALPNSLQENLITENSNWTESIKQVLQDEMQVSVSTKAKPYTIFPHFGWLIEAQLTKFEGRREDGPTLRRLCFLAEAYQCSLRFLCFVQLSQLFQLEKKKQHAAIDEFIKLETPQLTTYDYCNLLLITTDLLNESEPFMPEINEFVQELSNTKSELYSTSLFLENNRNRLIKNVINEDGQLPELLDEYLTALVSWLVKIAFISQYKMVSIKDIKLEYRMGEDVVNFGHVYGELNGIFMEGGGSDEEETLTKSILGHYTYNQSILLLKGTDINKSLDNITNKNSYLSLSPLIIDQSVYSSDLKDTPEIFFYSGQDASKIQYCYTNFKYEIPIGNDTSKIAEIESNKKLYVKKLNLNKAKLNYLYKQLVDLLEPFKTKN